MKISVISLFPDLYQPFLNTSLVRRAQEKGLIKIAVDNLLGYCKPKVRIDSPIFGHGAGMLLRPEIVAQAIANHEQSGPAYKVFFSPAGQKLNQDLLKKIAIEVKKTEHLMLLPARYEGMDARVEEKYADIVVSLGDFVLMGGDLPAMVLLEGLLRLVPGVVGKQESIEEESFSGPFVDHPHYTEPIQWQGMTVPEIVRSGNHKKIDEWRQQIAAKQTVLHHFDWLRSHVKKESDRDLARAYIPAHYALLMHTQVLLPQDKEGTSSVTSLDVHDIARSAKTYGIKKYFIVTPLEDQQKIIQKLMSFWQTTAGIEYNPHRHEALASVILVSSLDEALAQIKKEEGKEALLIATSAKNVQTDKQITYKDQEKVWMHERPVAFVFGTARGLAPSVIDRCDYLFIPVEGFSSFNHLSVRSAAAIIFDRWLGIQRNSTH